MQKNYSYPQRLSNNKKLHKNSFAGKRLVFSKREISYTKVRICNAIDLI